MMDKQNAFCPYRGTVSHYEPESWVPMDFTKQCQEPLLCDRQWAPCSEDGENKSRFLPQTWRTWRELVPREEEAGGPTEETVEDLLGLVCSPQSPWALLEGSSAEDLFLRQLAIRKPQMLKEDFLYSYFRSLQVVDKEVSLVDKDLLKFPKLEELVLSANQIKEIDAFNLPPTLKVLELYGNIITSMKCLCAHPPPGLQHLGLGHNKLLGPLQSMYITSQHWPNLVSLDLGFNDLTDLQGMMASLSTLQRLRLLVLQGNPLALVPYYRGFTIDSLARLCVLDDITVSSSEKHQFQGLRYKADVLAREAQFVVTIGNIRGVLDSSVLDPEPGPQGPFITYSYYVTYDFVEDEEGEGSEYGGVLAEGAPQFLHQAMSPTPPPSPAAPPGGGGGVWFTRRRRLPRRLGDPHPHPRTVLFSTVRKPWADVIPCNYEMQHTLRDLVPLKAFLLAGTTVTIVEEKILSWPMVPPPVDSSSHAKGKGEKEKEKKEKEEKEKEEKDKKGKDGKDKAAKGEKEKEQKGTKKKRGVSKELRQDPPILRVLGSGLVVLEPLLAGDPLVSTLCTFGVIRTLESDRLTFLRLWSQGRPRTRCQPCQVRASSWLTARPFSCVLTWCMNFLNEKKYKVSTLVHGLGD
ncbi:PREDICTED: leucine-rich repeat-containing protein 43 [Myotis brandtii]|uniref:leucine-rich repeat-containing protein 43 n=1 Tax=Myotis brandtii TaxID=109478 RepID=UPI0007041AA8|nr:PREDICTED: leucine-rich repeat-containing protein 43 [Myotis brandtii]